MPTPGLQRYESIGRRRGIDSETLRNSVATIARIRATDPRITPVLTLRHLSVLTDLPYRFLRETAARARRSRYRFFYMKKRTPGRSIMRMISVPPRKVAALQKWIVDNILSYTPAHEASFAFHPGSSPVHAAEQHPNTKWLLKVDIEDFFHSVAEGTVCRIFSDIGFPRLLSFELARICTVAVDRGDKNPVPRWPMIQSYESRYEGFLPQGAPTSPMLANLAMLRADIRLAEHAALLGFRYSRYADDLAFSCDRASSFTEMLALKRRVYRVLNEEGFTPNQRKSVVRGPGTRRIVLGMLVDGPSPRLSGEYKDMIRLHLHYLTSTKFGPAAHAKVRRTSVSGLYNHVRGLISWAEQVEPVFGATTLAKFHSIAWPPVQQPWIERLKAARR